MFAGLYMKTYTVADAGTILPQHSHRWPHISAVMRGGVHVWRGDDDLGEFHAPATIKIEAHTLHAFQTLTPGVVIACIHNADHLDADGEPAIHEPFIVEYED